MRIQHNIMAMNAYRNYTNNVSAMQKNLEKLSSGYKINRAGDDAAGLAISEKMRAQISGLEAAQKNAKDGISLVQTAEGALTEVHDMLNRMVTLATQSANGTYDNTTDRNQLQKEMEQLKSEINRIADSSNFNGIKLLDGSMSTSGTTTAGINRILQDVYNTTQGAATDFTGLKTILDGAGNGGEVKTQFKVDFSGLEAVADTTADAPPAVSKGSIETTKGGLETSEAKIEADDAITASTATVGTTANAVTFEVGDALLNTWSKNNSAGTTGNVKVDYGATTASKWTITNGTAGENIEATTASLSDDGKTLTLKDAAGKELLKISTDATDAAEADFQTAFAAAEETGFKFTAAANKAGDTTGTVGGTQVTYEAGDALSAALEKAGATDATPVKIQYDSANSKWVVGDGTKNIAGDITASVTNGVLTLSNDDGVLLTATADTTKGLADFQKLTTAVATNIVYTAPKTTTSVTIGDATKQPTYTATADLAAALEEAGGKNGVADGTQISVKYDDTEKAWSIIAGTGPTAVTLDEDISATYDATSATMTLKSKDGKTLLTIASADAAKTSEAQFTDSTTGFAQGAVNTTLVYKKGAEATTGAAAGGTGGTTTATEAKVSFNLGKDFSVSDVAVKTGDKAAEIAKAVYGGMTDIGDDNGMQVKINGSEYTVADNGDGTLTFTLSSKLTDSNLSGNFDWDVDISGASFKGNHTAGTTVVTPGQFSQAGQVANTVFRVEASDIKDGTKINIDGKSVTLAVGKDSKVTGNNVVDLKDMEVGKVDLNLALSRISEKMGDTTNFTVGVNDTSNGDKHAGLTVHKKDGSTEKYDTMEKLANTFSITQPGSKGLTLQIGDTAESFNQLNVSIDDMHTASLGLDSIKISDQDSAQAAVDAIKKAINQVSDVRGTLGATQNRLDHTINNLSVMTENIQDAESTIRDVDIAEEMMAYTKNNILIQSAQAMLAQANQVPQGVLQLLG